MSLAIFDLDNTLIGGDSDYLWGQFLVDKGLVDAQVYEKENQRFYEEYKSGKLDIFEFLRFSLKPLSQYPRDELLALRDEFMESRIEALMLPKAFELIRQHQDEGDVLLIITATNKFVTEPIANRLGVRNLLATEPELVGGQYTGELSGIPCFRDGKVKNLDNWLSSKGLDLDGSYFYSDSHNDLPLLERVTFPVAVDADAVLTRHAKDKGWPLISLR